MKTNYEYPIDYDWTREEMLAVIELLQVVEQAYEGGVASKQILSKYQVYKKYFKAILDEKMLDRDFKKVSGYSMYQVIKKARENDFVRL